MTKTEQVGTATKPLHELLLALDQPLCNLETAVRAALALRVMDRKGSNLAPDLMEALDDCVARALEHCFEAVSDTCLEAGDTVRAAA